MELYSDLVQVTLCEDGAGSMTGGESEEEDPIASSSSRAS